MGRWRPPRPGSSPYISPRGARALDEELKRLWKTERREVVRALAAAAAEGDRSENAEYIYRKKQLGEIDRRIRYLSKRLDEVRIVDQRPADQSVIRFGASVVLHDGQAERHYRILGADETSARRGWISIDSPVARALLGKRAGEVVSVPLPEGENRLEILAVRYDHEFD